MGGVVINGDGTIDSSAHDHVQRQVAAQARLEAAVQRAFPSTPIAINNANDVTKLVTTVKGADASFGQFVQDYVVGNRGLRFALDPNAISPLGRALGRETNVAHQPDDQRRGDAARAFLSVYDALKGGSALDAEMFRDGYLGGQNAPTPDRVQAAPPRLAVPHCGNPTVPQLPARPKC